MSGKKNPNAMDIAEYRNIKEALKTMPVNKATAEKLGRGTTTLATIKKSRSFKQYHELRKKNKGAKKIKEVNSAPVKINVKHLGGIKKIAVIRKGKLYQDGDLVVVPAALFEALSDQMNELSAELKEAIRVSSPQTYISTITNGDPFIAPEKTFKERLAEKVEAIRKRWEKK